MKRVLALQQIELVSPSPVWTLSVISCDQSSCFGNCDGNNGGGNGGGNNGGNNG